MLTKPDANSDAAMLFDAPAADGRAHRGPPSSRIGHACDWNDVPPSERQQIAERWLESLGHTLAMRRYDDAADLLRSDGYWRDLLAFDWTFTTLQGADEVRDWLSDKFDRSPARNFRVEGTPYVANVGTLAQTLDFFITFETEIALGRGHVRLMRDEDPAGQHRALTVLTTMKDLKDFPEPVGPDRPREPLSLPPLPEADRSTDPYADSDPDVVIVGAGHSGLMLGARLRQLDVKTLIVERSARVGETWRKRYRTLRLHNDITMNHFPYLAFPENWPSYLPKDKVADWLDFYATAMDLDIWTSTTFRTAKFDPVAGSWTVELQLADGSLRTMRPRHLVSAMGVSGLPNVPRIGGADDFAGTIIHSSQPFDDIDVKDKKIVVVGAGTSAHDIAQNFCLRGGDVTMIQRSSITVLSLIPSGERMNSRYRDDEGIRPTADTDAITAATPIPLVKKIHGPLSRSVQEADRELLDGLRKAGFLLDNGEDDTGFYLKMLRYHGGYYLNIGASDLIVEGKIKVRSGVSVDHMTRTRVVLTDGDALEADIVVLATGYHSLQEQVRSLLGSEIANNVGPNWGIGDDNELRNMFTPTAQENLFIVGGGFPVARFYSKFTALYICAQLNGLVN